MYKKYEANQTQNKVVESSIGGTFKGEHFDQNNPSGKLYFFFAIVATVLSIVWSCAWSLASII